MGKGWAKGLSAETDPRIARAAAGHRGLAYRRRQLKPNTLNQTARTWSAQLAYAVGLMATDGCLVSDRRHMSFGSEDLELVATFRDCLGLNNLIRELRTRKGRPYFRMQFGGVALYRWFESLGLTPRKSLTIGKLLVPDAFLFDLVRGLLDGDGSILDITYTRHRKGKSPRVPNSYYSVQFGESSAPRLGPWSPAGFSQHPRKSFDDPG